MLLFGLIIDTQTLATQLQSQATALLGEQGGELIEGMLEQANSSQRGWSAVFGVLAAAFGATTVFAELKGSSTTCSRSRRPRTRRSGRRFARASCRSAS